MEVSEKFLIRLKLNEEPAYRIAQRAGLSPCMLSKLIHGIAPLKPADPRIVAVGSVLGLEPSECFAPEEKAA